MEIIIVLLIFMGNNTFLTMLEFEYIVHLKFSLIQIYSKIDYYFWIESAKWYMNHQIQWF